MRALRHAIPVRRNPGHFGQGEREEITAKFRGMRAFSTLPFPDVPVHNE